jgi:hypothetical protein
VKLLRGISIRKGLFSGGLRQKPLVGIAKEIQITPTFRVSGFFQVEVAAWWSSALAGCRKVTPIGLLHVEMAAARGAEVAY